EQRRRGESYHEAVAGAPHVLGVAGGVVGGAAGGDHHVGRAFRERGQVGDEARVPLQHPVYCRWLFVDLVEDTRPVTSPTPPRRRSPWRPHGGRRRGGRRRPGRVGSRRWPPGWSTPSPQDRRGSSRWPCA